ncbi:hypothetical protein BDN72DRAFT_879521 [Pluteus cervinus]|uniref:Uncharacterized protein n=1 Tax=Pluteus cervinus TaxID=181527 RepID=A0ACD3APM9_9AGAR|nr:hypothetical protein BDN72DRAFT_879521 [Pluteus cervinus]
MNFKHSANMNNFQPRFSNRVVHQKIFVGPHKSLNTEKRAEMLHEVLQKLPTLGYSQDHDKTLRQTEQGTGQWFFNMKDFQKWCNGSPNTKAFLALGDPGVGKTCLVSLIIDHLQKQCNSPAQVAYIYLSHQEAEKQTPTKIVSTLLSQVLSTYKALPEYLTGLYEQLKLGQGSPQLGVLITALLNICKDKQMTTYIIFDALDECKSSYQPELIRFIQQLFTAEAWVLATCRPAAKDFEGIFDQVHAAKQTIRASADDISGFLNKKLESSARLQSLGNHQFWQKVVSIINTKSQGVFLIAAMQIDHISKLTTKSEIDLVLAQFPSGLNAHFEETLERIESQPENLVALAWSTMNWLLLACRPITAAELCHALGTQLESDKFCTSDLTSPATIIQSCYGFVTLKTAGQSEPIFQTDDGILVSWLEEVKSNLSRAAFYSYAAHYWGTHAAQCLNDKMRGKILNFMKKMAHLILWAQKDYGAEHLGEQEGKHNPLLLLHIAARFGLNQIISWRELGSMFVQINTKAAWTLETPLMLACRFSHKEMVKLLFLVPWIDSEATRGDEK